MWKKWKESEFYQKLKAARVNRIIYLSALVILLTLGVVLAITAATNRSKKPTETSAPTAATTPAPAPDREEVPTVKDDVVPQLASPVSGKLSKAHSVDVQVFSQTMQDWRVHLGIDILTEANAPVLAAAEGSVKKVWEDPMMGWCVAITHTGDCMTVYKNLSGELAEGISDGAKVQKGQLLGYVGDTAMMEIAEEPHLHMEMTVAGIQVDPMEYFSEAVIATLSKDTAFEDTVGK